MPGGRSAPSAPDAARSAGAAAAAWCASTAVTTTAAGGGGGAIRLKHLRTWADESLLRAQSA